MVARYESKTLKPNWKYLDRLEIELLYLNGVEEYRNIRRNGKRIKDQEEAIRSGTWSTGEFGSILIDILSTALPESFQFRKDSLIEGIAVKVYDFKVLEERSRWRIRYGPEVKPAYQGSLWVDPATARVIRIEMDSKAFQKTYEIEKVETVVDYRWTDVGGKKFLLPVKSENLSCIRDSFTCLRNTLEFRNYRKFEVESQVLTSDSDISFPEAEGGAKPGGVTPPSLTPEAKPTAAPPRKEEIGAFLQRGCTAIFRPNFGRSVMSANGSTGCPATGTSRQLRAIVASASTPSIHAKRSPTHKREPAPKGR